MRKILYVGRDIDDKNFHCIGLCDETGELFEFKSKPTKASLMCKLRELKKKGFDLKVCYDATYIGFHLLRELDKEDVVNNMGQNDSAQLNKIVSLLIEGLTEKQKQVLHHLFWKNRTQRETGQIMGIRHSSVQKIRERALTSLGKILLNSRKDLSRRDNEMAT